MAQVPVAPAFWLDSLQLGNWYAEGQGGVRRIKLPFPLTSAKTNRGVETAIPSGCRISLRSSAQRLLTYVGLRETAIGKAQFMVIADGRVVFKSDSLKPGGMPALIDLDLRGIEQLELLVDGGWIADPNLVAYWSDAKLTLLPQAKLPKDAPIILPWLDHTEDPVKGMDMANSLKCLLPVPLRFEPNTLIAQRVMVAGAKPDAIDVVGLPASMGYNHRSQLVMGKIDKPGVYPFTVVVKLGKKTLRYPNKLVIDEGLIENLPTRGWISPPEFSRDLSTADMDLAAMRLSESGLAAMGFNWLIAGDGWQGLRSDRLYALHPNNRFADMPVWIKEVIRKGFKPAIWMTTARKSAGGYIGTNADTFNGYLKHEYDDQPRGRLSFAAEDLRLWDSWGLLGLWLEGNDLTLKDANAYTHINKKEQQMRLLAFTQRQSAKPCLNLPLGTASAQLWEPADRNQDSWYVLRQQVLTLRKPTTCPLATRLMRAQPYRIKQDTGFALLPRTSLQMRKMQYGLYALWGFPLFLHENLEWLYNNRPQDFNLYANALLMGIHQQGGPQPTMLHWDEEKQSGIWHKKLADGSHVICWINLTNWYQDLSVQLPVSGQATDVWTGQQLGVRGGKTSLQIAPRGMMIWMIKPGK